MFMHGTWVSPEVYGLQLDRLATGGVLVLAPCGVEGLSGFAQFFDPDMKKFQSAYQARAMPVLRISRHMSRLRHGHGMFCAEWPSSRGACGLAHRQASARLCCVGGPSRQSASRQHRPCNLIGQQRLQHPGEQRSCSKTGLPAHVFAIRLIIQPLASPQGAMFEGAKEAVRQLRDPAGGPLLDQLRAARPEVKPLDALRWGFFGHSVGAES